MGFCTGCCNLHMNLKTWSTLIFPQVRRFTGLYSQFIRDICIFYYRPILAINILSDVHERHVWPHLDGSAVKLNAIIITGHKNVHID